MDKAWLNYHRCWAARNPECIKRYRVESKARRADSTLQSGRFRHDEYWELRKKFEKYGNMDAVLFSPKTKDVKPKTDKPKAVCKGEGGDLQEEPEVLNTWEN